MEIRQVEAALIHAERQTDGRTDTQKDKTKVIGAFHDYANDTK
jgi:hypothetical protein